MSNNKGWIGVDLDGTLAEYHGWHPDGGVGAPVKLMVDRVKRWLAEGANIRIFTARVSPNGRGRCDETHDEIDAQYNIIKAWCKEHIGVELPIVYEKDMMMIELWDDRCVQIVANTGLRADGSDVRQLVYEELQKHIMYLSKFTEVIGGSVVEDLRRIAAGI